jgi:N-glycosylase/DNA lyase
MQQVWAGVGDRVQCIDLPDASERVLGRVKWGRAEEPMTPAYWVARCYWGEATAETFVNRAGSLLEEVGFCLLGGFGITYEVNAAAFERLKVDGAFTVDADCDEEWFLDRLMEPLDVSGRRIRYRFPRQRARRLASFPAKLSNVAPGELSALALRERLLAIEGIGPKTASWIVRNLLASDEVAILDVHVLRACQHMHLFPADISLPKDYNALEQKFLDFASAINVRASILDAVMWMEMRAGRSALAA